jgi:hypothetical protein
VRLAPTAATVADGLYLVIRTEEYAVVTSAPPLQTAARESLEALDEITAGGLFCTRESRVARRPELHDGSVGRPRRPPDELATATVRSMALFRDRVIDQFDESRCIGQLPEELNWVFLDER